MISSRRAIALHLMQDCAVGGGGAGIQLMGGAHTFFHPLTSQDSGSIACCETILQIRFVISLFNTPLKLHDTTFSRSTASKNPSRRGMISSPNKAEIKRFEHGTIGSPPHKTMIQSSPRRHQISNEKDKLL